ncbi:MAG: BTAD domain-containing putative transcriptional regulator, partial [Chloroflexota bacterium]
MSSLMHSAFLLGSHTVTVFRHQQHLSPHNNVHTLTAYILLHSSQQVFPRNLLHNIFGPSQDHTPYNLEQTLLQAHTVLPNLQIQGDVVLFSDNQQYWIDALIFEQQALPFLDMTSVDQDTSATLTKTATLYQGDLLPDWGCDWVKQTRWRLKKIYQHLLEQLIATAKRSSAYDEALHYLDMYIASDPLREVGYRDMMHCQLLLGRTQQALHTYEACCTMLTEQRACTPEPETTALITPFLPTTQPSQTYYHVSKITLFLLGDVRVMIDDTDVLMKSTKAYELLAYLVLQPHRNHSRSMLCSVFWPERTEETARRSLSRVLSYIRAHLPPDLVQTDGDAIYLTKQYNVSVDVVTFRRHVCAFLEGDASSELLDDARSVLDLYQGHFLEGFYNEWVLVEQEALRRLYQQTLMKFIYLDKQHGQYHRAIHYVHRLIALDAFDEIPQQELLQIYLLLGNPQQAIHHYDTYVSYLSTNQLTPTDDLQRLAQLAHQQLPVTPSTTTTSPSIMVDIHNGPLVSRHQERQQLLDYVTAICVPQTPQGGLVLVEGEAGVGKSRLVQTLAQDAQWRGVTVLRGYCREQTSYFEPFIQIIQQHLNEIWAQQLAWLLGNTWIRTVLPLIPELQNYFPDLTPIDELSPRHAKERIIDAFVHFILNWSHMSPVLWIIEDLHWADGETLHVLTQVNNQLDSTPILIAVTYRYDEASLRDPVWHTLQTLDTDGVRGRLHIPLLPYNAVEQLLSFWLQPKHPFPDIVHHLHRQTGGNPLFLIELVQTLIQEELLIQHEDGLWSSNWDPAIPEHSGSVPITIEHLTQRRLEQLPPMLRQLVEWLAILGSQWSLNTMQLLELIPTQELLHMLHELIRLGYLVESDSKYQFIHDKIRKAIYDSIPVATATIQHRYVAERLVHDPTTHAGTIAYHFERAMAWEQAIRYYREAGKQARTVFASTMGVHYLGRALHILNDHHPPTGKHYQEMQFDLLMTRQELLWLTDQTTQQEVELTWLYDLATALKVPKRQIDVLQAHASFLMRVKADYDMTISKATEALTLADTENLVSEIAVIRRIVGFAQIQKGAYVEACNQLHQAIDCWHSLSTPDAIPIILYYELAVAYWRRGCLDEATQWGNTLIQMAEARTDRGGLAYGHQLIGMLADSFGDKKASLVHHLTCLEQSRQIGLRALESATLLNLGDAYLSEPDYASALDALHQALTFARQRQFPRDIFIACYNIGAIAASIGQYEYALLYAQESITGARQVTALSWEVLCLCTLGQIYLDSDTLKDITLAAEQIQVAWGIVETLDAPYEIAECAYWQGRVAKAQGQSTEAHKWFQQALTYAQKVGHTYCIASCYAALSELALNQNDHHCAAQWAQQAIECTNAETAPAAHFAYWKALCHNPARTQEAHPYLEKAYALLEKQATSLPHESWKSAFWYDVPVNNAIRLNYTGHQTASLPQYKTVRLPKASAARGGRLANDQVIDVTWTMWHPDDHQIAEKH